MNMKNNDKGEKKMNRLEKEKSIKIISIFLSGLVALYFICKVIKKISIKVKNRKNIYKKIKIVKEYEISLPKNFSKKQTNELVKEIVSDDVQAVGYGWKNQTSDGHYKLKKLKK